MQTSSIRSGYFSRKLRSLSMRACILALPGLCAIATTVAAAPVPDVNGTSWAGIEVFRGRLSRFGAVQYTGPATLSVNSTSDYVYIDPDGIQFSGQVVQKKRRLQLTQDPEAIAAVETQLAGIIVDELTAEGIDPGMVQVTIIPSTIRLNAQLRSNRAGSSVLFTSSMRFTAESTVFGTRGGSFTTRGVLGLLSDE